MKGATMENTAPTIQENETTPQKIQSGKLISELDKPQVEVGQIVSTLGRTVAVPAWHKVWKWIDGKKVLIKVGSHPCVKIYDLGNNEDTHILTRLEPRGLVCFMPHKCIGGAILSVRIKSVHRNSVAADPVEWIEIRNPEKFLSEDDMGEFCDDINGRLDKDGYWHHKYQQ
jgi:hypothetical protein